MGCSLLQGDVQSAAAEAQRRAELADLGPMGLLPLSDLVAEYQQVVLQHFDCYTVRCEGV